MLQFPRSHDKYAVLVFQSCQCLAKYQYVFSPVCMVHVYVFFSCRTEWTRNTKTLKMASEFHPELSDISDWSPEKCPLVDSILCLFGTFGTGPGTYLSRLSCLASVGSVGCLFGESFGQGLK